MKDEETNRDGDSSELPAVPTGIERLLRHAANDERIRQALLQRRHEVAQLAKVPLTGTEAAILQAIPAAQLTDMVDNLPAPLPRRRQFLRQSAASAAVLLGGTALAEGTAGCGPDRPHRECAHAVP